MAARWVRGEGGGTARGGRCARPGALLRSAAPARGAGPLGPGRAGRGFSLLELILVLLLLSLTAGLVVPSLRSFARTREANDAAAQMLALMQYAAAQAVVEARPFRFCVDPKEGTYWLEARKAGGFARPESDYGQTFELPDDTEVGIKGSDELMQRTPPYIEFDARGGHEVADIRLNGFAGVFRLICASPAEPYWITDEDE